MPNNIDLTTLASVKQYMGLTGSTDDALLAALITAASQFAATYCSRNFYVTAYSETRDGVGGAIMSTVNRPIVSVASVNVNGYPVIAFGGWPGGTPGFDFDDNAIYYVNGCFSRSLRNVVFNYSAGYVTLSGSPLAPVGIPADLQQAVNEMVTIKFKRRTNLAIRSETLAQQTITYELSELSPGVISVLDLYNSVTPL